MRKRLVASLLIASIALSLVACGDKKSSSVDSDAKYTYRDVTSSIKTFSPTDWEINSEGEIIGFTITPLYDFFMNDAKDGYEVVPSFAAELPEDVTAEFAGNETYGVPADATEGYAYRVKIRDCVTWDDGTPITTKDFDYSLRQYLNPDMKNYRASSFYSGSTGLANAQSYYSGGFLDVFNAETGEYADVADDQLYFTTSQSVAFFGDSLETYYNNPDYQPSFMAADGTDLYAKLVELSSGTYTALTAEVKDILVQLGSNFGCDYADAYKEFCAYSEGAATWDQVGFIADDDYTMTFVLTNACNLFDFEYGMGIYLVKEDLYEANKKDMGGITKSTYGTSVDKFASYGPYKVTSYQEGKEIKLTKNENWWGYSSDLYEGKYMTTDIVRQQIDEHTTELNMFLQGNLDYVLLTSDDVDSYGSSEYTYYKPETYTYFYALNSSLEKLKSMEEAGENKSILAYKEFREAISYAVDRKDYTQSCTAGSKPTYTLLNNLYVSDPATGESYRSTEAGQSVVKKLYNTDNAADVTGYDVAKASELIQAAYDKCYADGNINDTDVVTLDFHIYGSDAHYQKIVDFLDKALADAAKGTSLEGRTKINLLEDQDYYNSCKSGLVDIAFCSWGGASMDPFSLMQCYCTDTYNNSYGFDVNASATINVQGQDITKTFYEWQEALIGGEYATADYAVRCEVLSGIEEAVLETYTSVPIYSRVGAEMYSQRLVLGSEEYVNSIIEFGGIMYITWTMNDDEWADYCASQNNKLTY